jgi:GTPase Era involved in 16S rRNA processing/uncharacterized protein (DUF2062 family)
MTTETNQNNQVTGGIIDFNKTLTALVGDLKKLKGFYIKLKLENVSLLDEVLGRVENHSFKVAVVGEFKRGKSTFINALLGQDILPSDINPTTATVNRVTYAIAPLVKVIFKDGREEEVAIDKLKDYVTKLTVEAKKTATNVKEAVVYYPVHYCEKNVDIIDTPGLNDESVMDQVTFSVLPEVDAAIMLIMPLAPFAETERQFLVDKLITSDLGRVIFVVNAIDRCNTPEEAEKSVSYIRDRIQEHVMERAKEKYGENSPEYEVYKKKIGTPKVFGISAYQALQAKCNHDNALLTKSRFREFEVALEQFLTQERGATILQVPINRAIASATEILKAISLQENGLAMNQKQFEAAYNKSVAEINDLRSKKAQEMKLIDAAAEEVKHRVLPLVERLEEELKLAANSVITSTEIQPSELSNKKALLEKLGRKVSNAVQKAAQKLSEQIQGEIEHGLVKEVYRLQNFAKSVDQALQHIDMQFLSIDADTQTERNAITGGLAAALAIYTGFGGIWSGYQEGGLKGVAVGTAGSIGTLFAAGAIAGLIGLPITFPVVIAASILSYFTGGWLTQAVFGGERVEHFKENYSKKALEEIEKQLRESRIDQKVNQQIYETFDALKQKVHQEVETLLENTQSTLTNLRAKRERDIVLSENQLQELKQMQEDTKQILSTAQRLSQQLIQQVNVEMDLVQNESQDEALAV